MQPPPGMSLPPADIGPPPYEPPGHPMPQPGFIPPHVNADGTYMPPGKLGRDLRGAQTAAEPSTQCITWAAVQPLLLAGSPSARVFTVGAEGLIVGMLRCPRRRHCCAGAVGEPEQPQTLPGGRLAPGKAPLAVAGASGASPCQELHRPERGPGLLHRQPRARWAGLWHSSAGPDAGREESLVGLRGTGER